MKHDYTEIDLKEMIARHLDPLRIPNTLKIITDTTNFIQMEYNDVLVLENRPYLIRNCEREGRFTIDEQPKFWVRKAVDLQDGSPKIIKMVFHEKYNARVGSLIFECFRSPKKESAILDLVQGHVHFMQGFTAEDTAGNIIRIIDHIPGKTLADEIASIYKKHEEYFFENLPDFLNEFLELVQAIQFLHSSGEKHGDIRRDHIIRDSESKICKWIDFDYNFYHKENMFGFDLFGLGNVLAYISAGDELTLQNIKENFQDKSEILDDGDCNIIFSNRVVNLKKIYPYIPEKLNRMLMHFSKSAEIFYDDTDQFLNDLKEVIYEFPAR